MTANEPLDVKHVSLLWAGPEYASEIAALHKALFVPPWPEPEVAKLLQNAGATALVARHGFPKATVGFAMAQIAADEAEILSLGVTPQWQRRGLGLRLLDGIMRALHGAGTNKVFLEVAADNAAAHALYAKAGFAEVGRRKKYYQRPDGIAVDALQLSRPL
ncbi:MAG: ribosomal protein S18-alanine N-acetyltransferase [Hyphomicrobiaceae bacterium]